MTHSTARFAGSIPETYDRHLGPLLFEPYAVDLAGRLAVPAWAGPRFLELACGTGIVTRHLLKRVPPGGTLVATDLNQPMMDVARARLGDVPGIEWRQADATDLPFSADAFDAVVCQFGLMFFPDKPKGIREAFRVLRPNGSFLFNVWDSLEENPLGRIAHETIASFFRTDPPEFYEVPFGFHDTKAIRTLLRQAGFLDVTIDTVRLQAEGPSAEHVAVGLVRGNPVLNAIQERATADADTIVAAVRAALVQRYGDRPLRVPMQAHVVSAWRPREAA